MRRLLAFSLLLFATAANAVTYNLATLASLSSGGDSIAYGMNDSGAVVGSSFNSTTNRMEAVIWNNGIVQSLGVEGLARAVNNSGVVVGETGSDAPQGFTGNGRAFSWQNNTYNDLGDLGGTHSAAFDINDSGMITGWSYTNYEATGVFQSHAFKYANGQMADLGTVSVADGYSRGHAINEAGEVAGRASLVRFTDSDKFLAYWDADGNLTSIPGPGNYSTAEDMNNNGVIVGTARGLNGQQQASVWTASGQVLLGTFGGNRSTAFGVNDAGAIVGYARDASGQNRAFLSLDGVTMIDLNTLVGDLSGWASLDEAYDINAAGEIVGIGTLTTGEQAAFVLTAVPFLRRFGCLRPVSACSAG